MKETFEKDPWFVEYELGDGARLTRLSFNGFDLLTTAPSYFKLPSKNYGEYETRPVYGYDDCFPSVEVSRYPGLEWIVPDHGELCWLEWNSTVLPDKIIFSVESEALPIIFKRTLHFQDTNLIWKFEVQNNSDEKLPFLHIMHPLIKLTGLADLQFPDFKIVNSEFGDIPNLKTSDDLKNFLFSSTEGDFHMLYIQNVKENIIKWTYKNDLQVRMVFPVNMFSSIGIWWNYKGYPDEDGIRRDECAFEPISGNSSKLIDSYNQGSSQWVGAKETISWEFLWTLRTNLQTSF
jgi:hypothetical protein